MALSFDSVGTGLTNQSPGTTVTWTHTVGALTQGVLIAGLKSGGSATLNSLVFAGQNMTKYVAGTSATAMSVDVWYLLNPPSGLGTFNGTWTAGGGTNKIGVSMAYAGVDQNAPLLGSAVNNPGITTSTSGSITNTTMAPANWFVGFQGLTVAPGTTAIGNERGTTAQAAASNELQGADVAGGTLRWTSPSARILDVGVILNPTGSVAFDAKGTFASTSGSVYAIPHTVVSNTNGILIVGFGGDTNGSLTFSPNFAGQTMTRIKNSGTTAAENMWTETWYVLNPPTGLGTILGTASATMSNFQATSISYTNVDQTTPIVGSVVAIPNTTGSGSVTNTSLGVGNKFVTFVNTNNVVGSQLIGALRGTATGASDEAMGLDSEGGTIRVSTGANLGGFGMVGLEVKAFTPPATTATYTTFMTLMGAGNI